MDIVVFNLASDLEESPEGYVTPQRPLCVAVSVIALTSPRGRRIVEWLATGPDNTPAGSVLMVTLTPIVLCVAAPVTMVPTPENTDRTTSTIITKLTNLDMLIIHLYRNAHYSRSMLFWNRTNGALL